MPAVNILIFFIGLVSLIKGADLFVFTSSQIARKVGVSEFIIGLTLVSVGTSVPELAAALTASFQQASGIVLGNILGSNIANIGLIASTAALLKSIKTEEVMLRRDGYIMLFSSFLLFLFMLDFRISRLEALILILLYITYPLFLLNKVKRHGEEVYFKDFLIYFLKFEYLIDLKSIFKFKVQRYEERKEGSASSKSDALRTGKRIEKETESELKTEKETESELKTEKETESELKTEKETESELKAEKENWTESGTKSVSKSRYEDIDSMDRQQNIDPDTTEEPLSEISLLTQISKLIVSGAAIIFGAKFFVDQAIFFAVLLRVPETLIGVSLVAVGTSVPELMVTISAARSNYAGIALGNIIGSNITNILLILGCSGLVHPITTTGISIYYIAPFMLITSALLLLFIRTDWEIKRFEGFILFLLYTGFMVLLLRMG